MKLGIILFILGSVFAIYLANIKFKKLFFKRVGIVLAVLIAIYGLILFVQPDNYIKYTHSTIQQSNQNGK